MSTKDRCGLHEFIATLESDDCDIIGESAVDLDMKSQKLSLEERNAAKEIVSARMAWLSFPRASEQPNSQ